MSVHIGAEEGAIAETVLLPGDPLRAKFIAEHFLSDVHCYTKVRNMFGFTGTYKGVRISVQGAGMGLPSTAIYVNELINEYAVKTIIRVGTTGSLRADLEIGQTVLVMSASTDSNINRLKFDGMDYAPTADFELLVRAKQKAQELAIPVHIGGIFSTDSFYGISPERYKKWSDHGVLGLEMESTALYTIAAGKQVKALTILTVSDNLITGAMTTSEEREQNIEDVARLALESAI